MTIRLLDDVDLALKRKNKLALVGCSILIILLILAMFWPLS
jgi:N-terminal TM domain of oligopeptide transport permease C